MTALWMVLLAVPLFGLWLLVEAPDLDPAWENHPAHFWLVLAAAAVSFALGWVTGEAARRRSDARVFLVALAFLASAGFLGLHALATPAVLLDGKNAGFTIATPVGLLLAAALAAVSSLELSPERSEAIMRRQSLLRGGLVAILLGWAAVSLAQVPPLDDPIQPHATSVWLKALAGVGVALYAFAAVRYYLLYRRRPAQLVLAIFAAFVFLAEAMVAIAYSVSWHVSWWEWHVLMVVAYGLVAWAARAEYRRERTAEGTFAAVYLDHTIARVDAGYGEALKEVVAAQRGAGRDERLLDDVATRYGLSGEQRRLLEQAAGQVRQIDEVFRPYVSPQLADRLEADPRLAELGGEERDVSVLFADLQGFTAFSEGATPADVIGMLNEYWGVAVPLVLREHGGVIERFAGDAVMVVFNAAGDQPDHALRAARAALDMQRTTDEIANGRLGWPRFRAGVNSGPAIVGHVGTREQRSFTAIGDTTNLASRLQSSAGPGQVVISGSTRAGMLDPDVEPLPPLEVKGKAHPVEAYVLRSVD